MEPEGQMGASEGVGGVGLRSGRVGCSELIGRLVLSRPMRGVRVFQASKQFCSLRAACSRW